MTDGGYYMYMEASSPAATSNTAVLQYKTLPAGQPFCVHFWYHMYGNSMGSLRILAKVILEFFGVLLNDKRSRFW